MKLLLSFATVLLVLSCGDKDQNCAFIPDTSSINLHLEFEALEDSLPAITTKSQLVEFMRAHPDTRDIFFNRGAYPGDSAFIDQLFLRFTNPHIDTLLQETHRVFGNGEGLRHEFQQAFANLMYYYPTLPPPRIQTNISGLENDLFVTDSVIFIGLDYFLGPGSKIPAEQYV